MSNKNQNTSTENQNTSTENQGNEKQGSTSKTTKKKVNKADELVPVFIPKQSRNDTERFVAVNGERILIKTGMTVEVPRKFAEVIKNSEKMAAEAAAYIDANISV